MKIVVKTLSVFHTSHADYFPSEFAIQYELLGKTFIEMITHFLNTFGSFLVFEKLSLACNATPEVSDQILKYFEQKGIQIPKVALHYRFHKYIEYKASMENG